MIRVSLSSDGFAIVAESEHGLPISLPRDPAAAGIRLLALLREAERPKVLARNVVDGSALALVLAEWQKVDDEGGGRIPRAGTEAARRYPAITADATPRRYSASGRVIAPASWDQLEPF